MDVPAAMALRLLVYAATWCSGCRRGGGLGRGEGDGRSEERADGWTRRRRATEGRHRTSTAGCGPPRHVAVRVRPNAPGWSRQVKGGGLAGGVPWSTHLSKAVNPAWTTLCWGPLLTGVVQPSSSRPHPRKRRRRAGCQRCPVRICRCSAAPPGHSRAYQVGLRLGHEDRDHQVGADAQDSARCSS